MLHFKKRIKAIFAKPEKKLAAVMPELIELRTNLNKAAKSTDALSAIVLFFDSVSKLQDRGVRDIIDAFEEVNIGQYDYVLKNLNFLKAHLGNAGRESYGWNRTKVGEKVTDDKVFLGNIYGLFTHPVSYWEKKKDDKKGGWGFRGMKNLNSYDVVSQQARSFMTIHVNSMIGIINDLEEFTSQIAA